MKKHIYIKQKTEEAKKNTHTTKNNEKVSIKQKTEIKNMIF